MNVLHAFAYEWRFSIAITLAGLAFFGGLTIASYVHRNKRVYIPGLLLIDFGILSSLIRNLFFFQLSPHPARPGGLWRLASALLIVWGFVLFLRAWQRDPVREHESGAAGRHSN